MSNVLADGSYLALGTTYGPAVVMSAVTNATEAVATLAAGHLAVVGDFVEVSSSWPGLDGKVLRIKTVATNDVTLEGFNTASIEKFPIAGGVGSIKRITAWMNVAQIVGFTSEGGDQNYKDFQYLNETQGRQIPTSKSPSKIKITLADDITLVQQATIRTADEGGVPRAMRIIYRNGTRTVTNGYWSMAYFAQLALGDINKREVSVAMTALPQDYAA